MSESGGCQVAYGDVLDAFPSWSSLTEVSGWEIRRGRTDEFTRTGTGTATIYVDDQTGYLGSGAEFPVHAQISLRGSPMFRGYVDEINVEVVDTDPSVQLSRVAISCVDAFDVLAGIEVAPADPVAFGDAVPAESEGNVFYENGQVDDRIIQALNDAGWPNGLRSIFSGNVNVMETVYDPGATILQIIQDAADAEFPTVANLFVASDGTISFRGRFARFNPTAYGINEWVAGTGSNVTSGVAQIRRLSYTTPKKQVFNSALCFPDPDRHTPSGTLVPIVMEDQVRFDATSVAKWGVRSWSAENVLTLKHNSNGNTGAEECQLFAQYVVDNYSNPKPRVSKVGFRSLLDGDYRAAATWALMQGVEIGDLITLNTPFISDVYFIEGITATAKELNGDIPDVSMELDLSPRSYWDSDPF